MKVSIIIPCYNSEKWIEECVLSALQQTYADTEVIFVDNESTDGSVDLVKKIKEKHSNLIMSSAKNLYPNCWDEPRSKGLELMSGDYFTVIGSDDFLSEKYVENCMKIIMKAPDKIKALQSPMQGVQSTKDNTKYSNILGHSYSSIKEFKELCLKGCPVNTPSVMYSAELYRKKVINTKPETYGGAADYDMYCSMSDAGVFIYPAPVWLGFFYRWHEDQATWKMHKDPTNYDIMIQEFWREKWKTAN